MKSSYLGNLISAHAEKSGPKFDGRIVCRGGIGDRRLDSGTPDADDLDRV